MKPKRIFFYSHDTVGLGHIRRTQKIANQLASPDRSILIACASPVASSYQSEPGIEYLNLPGFTKLITGEYVPRNLNVPAAEFVSLRSSLLLAAVSNFSPDLVIVDKEPLGVKRELSPALQYLREIKPEARIICGFRDILDDKQATLEEWARKGTLEALANFYDKIFVYGDAAIFDFVREYEIPEVLAAKIEYTGYVNPDRNRETSMQMPQFGEARPLVTFTLGGGGDGEELIHSLLSMLGQEKHAAGFNTLLLTGPFIARNLLDQVKRLETERNDFRAIRFTSNTLALFERSDLVVTMGGYNSLCELLVLRKYPLVIPRITPRVEQLIRARVFSEKKYCEYLDPRELNASTLIEKLNSMHQLKQEYIPPAFHAHGLQKIEARVKELIH